MNEIIRKEIMWIFNILNGIYAFRASEDEIDSPTHMGESNGNSSESESGQNNDHQYGDLTIQTFWPKVTEEIRKINVVC